MESSLGRASSVASSSSLASASSNFLDGLRPSAGLKLRRKACHGIRATSTMGPYTGRDPSVKKPAWLRQRAPQGEKLAKLKDSITSLKLNTVCEEAQCPNIGEVSAPHPLPF